MIIQNKIKELPWHATKTWRKRKLRDISKLIIHQEAGESPVSGVNNYHINKNHISKTGCPHFCYHYGIEKDGTIIQANELTDVTWHTKGQNKSAIGIMLVGNFEGATQKRNTTKPTAEQMEAMKQLVIWLQGRFRIEAKNIFGHADFGKINCPGNIVQNWINKYKEGYEVR